jgi:hypothetical protein
VSTVLFLGGNGHAPVRLDPAREALKRRGDPFALLLHNPQHLAVLFAQPGQDLLTHRDLVSQARPPAGPLLRLAAALEEVACAT